MSDGAAVRKEQGSPDAGSLAAGSLAAQGEGAPAAQARKLGRPRTRPAYTVEVGDRIAERHANGLSLREVFKMPDVNIDFYDYARWLKEEPSFLSHMTHARAAFTEYLVDTSADEIAAHPDPQKARIAVDLRKWKASKWSPTYADKVQVDVQHKVSIASALARGEARLRSMSDQLADTALHAIDITPLSAPATSDNASSAASEAGDEDELPDFMR